MYLSPILSNFITPYKSIDFEGNSVSKEFIITTSEALTEGNTYKIINDKSDICDSLIKKIEEVTREDIIEIAELKSLWGQGLSEPYVALEGINVHADNVTLMSADKNPTLKITLPNGVSLIKFKSSVEEYESFKTTGCTTLNIVGRCERNIWNGKVSAQILIEDYDIEKVMQYYF